MGKLTLAHYQKIIKKTELQRHFLIGKSFPNQLFTDQKGKVATIDHSISGFTIVNFWFAECKPCIEEMKQFPNLISQSKNPLFIVSICINNYNVWKNSFIILFCRNDVSNWQHLVLHSSEPLKLNNSISADNISYMENQFGTKSYPFCISCWQYRQNYCSAI